jgi:hypothetical protein
LNSVAATPKCVFHHFFSLFFTNARFQPRFWRSTMSPRHPVSLVLADLGGKMGENRPAKGGKTQKRVKIPVGKKLGRQTFDLF